MSESQLVKRAVQLFPQTKYTDEFAVRQMRQKWVRASIYLMKHNQSTRSH